MRIVNLVDNVRPVNAGIWQAAVSTAPELCRTHGITSEVWFPAGEHYQAGQFPDATPVPLPALHPRAAVPLARQRGLTPADTLVVTHGMWQYPTRWGNALRRAGFAWVHVPHGMLEPWALRQKWLKKWLYFYGLERRRVGRAQLVRAVGGPEHDRLRRHFERVALMANGVPRHDTDLRKPARRTVLFMARLHHKKGVVPLVQAWRSSTLATRADYQLVIAGPDDGEAAALRAALPPGAGANVRCVGALYGAEKEQQLRESHFFVLPSHSEGFPTTVPEVMQWGLIPLISEGCNFPEAFAAGLALRAEPDVPSIRAALEQLPRMDEPTRQARAERCRALVWDHYTLETLAARQAELCRRLLANGQNHG